MQGIRCASVSARSPIIADSDHNRGVILEDLMVPTKGS
jgi:hypothetical protein